MPLDGQELSWLVSKRAYDALIFWETSGLLETAVHVYFLELLRKQFAK